MKKIIVFLIPFTFLLLAPHVSADVGLSISPPVTEILIAPTKSLRTTLQLTNTGADSSVILSLHSLIPTGDQGHSTINPQPLDLTSIPLVIKLTDADFGSPLKISAGQTRAITLELEAASLDQPTDVYFALLARPIDSEASPTLSAVSPGITALILATVTPVPALPTDVALRSPHLPTLHDNTRPLDLDLSVENKTNIMLQVQAKVKLISPNQTVLSESNIDPKLILGNTTRLLSPFTFPLSPSYLGPHTISIELLTLGGKTLSSHTYVVWLMPIKYLLILIVIIFLSTIPLLRKINLTIRVGKA